MKVELSLDYEDVMLLRFGLALAIDHAKKSKQAMKHDPLEVYRNDQALQHCKDVNKYLETQIHKEIIKKGLVNAS